MGQTNHNSSSEQLEENIMLRESAIAFCKGDAAISRLKTLKQKDVDFDSTIWDAMVEMGWAAIAVPEDCGGLGLDISAAAIVAEELGRVVAPEPIMEIAGLSATLLSHIPASELRAQLLLGLASGNLCPITCTTEFYSNAGSGLPLTEPSANGFILSGICDYVPMARSASGFLVPATLDTQTALFWVPSDTAGLSIDSRLLADNTSHAQITFTKVRLTKDMILGSAEIVEKALNYAIDYGQILTAAYLRGLTNQTLETTLDYLRTRRQFGRTIGSFQALQHRAVDLFVQCELTNAVVNEAVINLSQNTDPRARATFASRAKVRATDAALAVTRAAIQMHGAIGFTYECDIGHYLNRAMVLGSRQGNVTWHLRKLAGLFENDVAADSTEAERSPKTVAEPTTGKWNDLNDSDFRLLVRDWFEQEYPTELRYPPRRLHWNEIKPWYLKLSRKGWVAPNWPVEYGGMGLSPAKVLIFIEEQERWGVARAPDMGITMIGPLLIDHGNPDQRTQYLPKILSGEHVWCQGYSEPNAGSDLASLQCEAILSGDEFVVNGQKTWTTLAQDATHIFLLVRTNKAVKHQAGISFLLLDLSTPGINIKPIRNLAGDKEFCEVFFDDVHVPVENLVGDLNAGWGIAKALLSFERIFLGSPKQCQYALQRLESIANGVNLFKDPGFTERFTRLKLDTLDLESIYARFAEIVRDGGTLGPDVSLLKIWATETFARLTELMLEAAGEKGAERGELSFGTGHANILSQFYNARPATIYGGSNEIQRNIIAKNVLHLPDS
ncbi:MAG TPA: acyl-CoA dehydrogenase [Gammaproteobacteria bacterium]|nr:acyl-CoA dehydrogenase [Gammaproteobacteria bacterium]